MPDDQLALPLFTIDFEASGLREFTHPIEIGIARWESSEVPLETCSALIRPPEAWREHRVWNREAKTIHGIRREQLETGSSPREALIAANEFIGSHVAFCDGGEHDLRWLLHLAQAARAKPSFTLADWADLGRAAARFQPRVPARAA